MSSRPADFRVVSAYRTSETLTRRGSMSGSVPLSDIKAWPAYVAEGPKADISGHSLPSRGAWREPPQFHFTRCKGGCFHSPFNASGLGR
jgi:hypothetical protein